MGDPRRLAGVILLTGLATACAHRAPMSPEPFPRPAAAGKPLEPGCSPSDIGCAPSAQHSAILIGPAVVAAALKLRGAPYAPGGSTPEGFDCSGFVQYVFASEGIELPRTVREQFLATTEINRASVAAGDLLFFRTSGPRASHVGIAIGDGTFVHAPSSRGVVRVETLASVYWRDRLASARRVP